jgi:hypothetical protein
MASILAHKRLWLPFVAAAVCLAAATLAGPALTLLLIIAAFGFALDGATLLFSGAGQANEHRQ